MTLDWSPLRAAITPETRLWWRDDDATAPSAALDRLVALRAEAQMPLHLAVIPARCKSSLVRAIAGEADVLPLVHGWVHKDRSDAGQKTTEFPKATRGTVRRSARGLARLGRKFGADLVPVFVPPWNRLGDDVAACLGAQGYAALSTHGPRARQVAAGVARINTHVDPIDWRGTRSAVDGQALIDRAAAQLWAHPSEPLGLLTHHLVHDPAIWAISRAFLLEALDAGAQPMSLRQWIASGTP